MKPWHHAALTVTACLAIFACGWLLSMAHYQRAIAPIVDKLAVSQAESSRMEQRARQGLKYAAEAILYGDYERQKSQHLALELARCEQALGLPLEVVTIEELTQPPWAREQVRIVERP